MSKATVIMKSLLAPISLLFMLATGSIAQAQPFAYIANQNSNNVSVIDTATNTVVATVPVGGGPLGVAVNSAGTRAYVTNQNSSNVSVIDTATNTVAATVAVGSGPKGVAVNPADTRAYVVNQLLNNVSVIDTATNTVVATVAVGASPYGVAVNPAGTRAYVTNPSGSNSTVSVIDTATNSVVATVAVGNGSYGVAVNPAGTRAYVTNAFSNNVSVIDTSSNTVVATVAVAVGSSPFGVAVNPAGTRAYVASQVGNVAVIDTATNTVFATVAVGSTPSGVAVNPAGTRAYVGNVNSNNVSVIDTATNTVVATVAVGTTPFVIGLFIGTPPTTVPGFPTIGTATAGAGSATVSFAPPASSGSSPITSYTVTSNPGGITAIGTASPITVTGLTNGTAYTFRVAAINAVGTSQASPVSNSVMPAAAGVPGAPTIGPATAGSVSATVSFTPPTSSGSSAITSYTATASPGGFTASSTGSPIIVTGLSSGTPYTFTVTATNASGIGVPSAQSNSVTPTPPAPAVTITGLTTFPDTAVGGTSAVQNVTITNSGTATLIFSLTHSNAALFRDTFFNDQRPAVNLWCFIGADASGAPLTGSRQMFPGQSCTFQLVFKPTALGLNTANIVISSNATPATTTITLMGNGVTGSAPAIPGTPTAIAQNGHARVSFAPSASTGLGTTVYAVISSPPGGFDSNGGSSESVHIVTGLTNGIAYTFTVVANYGAGSSAPSPASNAVTPTTPTQTLPAAIPQDGLLAYYPFSTAPNDLMGGGNFQLDPANATIVNNSLNMTGGYGGTNGSQTLAGVGYQKFTTIIDFKFAALPTNGTILTLGRAYRSIELGLTAAFAPRVTLNNGATTTNLIGPLALNTWHRAIMVVDVPALQITLYINGVQQAPIALPSGFAFDVTFSSFNSFDRNFSFFNFGSTGAFKGDLNNLLVYGRALSNTEALSINRLLPAAGVASVPPTITSTAPPAGIVAVPYSFTATASGTVPITWSLAGGALPVGLSLNATSGIISGTPTTAGSFTFTIQASNGTPPNAQQAYTIVVNPPSPVISSPTTASGSAGTAFTYQITANNTPTSFGATGLPAGLTVNTTSGVISGTPSLVGSFSATISATNAGGTQSQALTIAITVGTVAPTITSAAPAGGTVGTAYSHTFTATGTTPITWSVASGTIPGGLALNATNGVLSGTPTTSGSFAFAILASNGTAPNAQQATTITIAPITPTITSVATANGVTGSAFTYAITANNGPTSFGATGLPAGLTINTGSGVISGTPSAAGVFNATISAINAAGTGTRALTITITAAAVAPTITSAAPLAGTVGTAYSHTFTASGTTPIAWAIISGSAPTALTLNATTGVLSGTPTVAGSFGFAVSASNSTLPSATQNVTIIIGTPLPVITSAANAIGSVGNPFSYAIVATNAPTSFGATGLPAGFSINTSTGVISGTPSATGSFSATITATNVGGTAGRPLTITITAAPSPAVTLTPSSVNFGTRTVNTTSPATAVTLTNSGSANLVINSISGSGNFGFTSTCPITTAAVAAAGSCTISVTFTPLTVAPLTGSITITSSAPGSPHVIALSGSGAAVAVPGISLTPETLTFAARTINTTSAAQMVTVTNTGFANLNISAVTVAAPFSRLPLSTTVTPPDCATSVAPGSSCQIGVVFTPASTGVLTGQLSIASDASGSPHTVALSGTGTPVPVAVISTTSPIAFGDQIINSSRAQSVTINNTGTATLTISAITLAGTNATSFSLTGQTGCASIAVAGSCTLTATFNPTTTGAKAAQINLTSNAQNAATVNTIALTGNGILAPRPIAELNLTAIGFGEVIFGGATPNKIVTLTNRGGLAMSISSIDVAGDFVQNNDCGSSLAPLASCTINVIFTPLGQSSAFGELVVNSNAETSPDRVQLSGTGCRWFSQSKSRIFLTVCGN